MAGTPEDDSEAFSPSIFLDLPPTPPRCECDGDDPAASSSGDPVLFPFISRMLMEEEEIDESFFAAADHDALLKVQQPFAEILSAGGATAAPAPSSSDANGTGSADATGKLDQPTPFPDTGGDVNNAASADDDEAASALPPAAGGELQLHQGALVVSGALFNQAFLRGMEEAKRFLPAISSGGGGFVIGSCRREQSKKKDGRNRRADEDYEYEHPAVTTATTCRRYTKLMLSLPEEEADGEMVDQMILRFSTCLDLAEEMKKLGATKFEKTKKTTRKKNGNNNNVKMEAVRDDLHTMLLHCAQAVGTNDRWTAAQLLRQIKEQSSPMGDANQRLAHCFAEGLEARLSGTGTQVYRSFVSKRTSAVEYLKAYQVYLKLCSFKMTSFAFSNKCILKAIATAAPAGRRRRKVHIVDYGIDYGMQWPTLLGGLAAMKGGAPLEVRITGIDRPQPGFRPSSRLDETGRRLSCCARKLGLPFKFHGIAESKWETIRAHDHLGIHPEEDELLVVNSLGPFSYLIDDGVDVDSPSPRDAVLDSIHRMRPDLFVLCTMNASYSSPFFVTRFREALSFYTALFDMLDATIPRDNQQRLLVERDLFGRYAFNVVACEGWERVVRPEAYRQWQVRNHRAGLRQLPLDLDIVRYVRENIARFYHKDFVIDTDQQWLLQGWKGRILYATSTWTAT